MYTHHDCEEGCLSTVLKFMVPFYPAEVCGPSTKGQKLPAPVGWRYKYKTLRPSALSGCPFSQLFSGSFQLSTIFSTLIAS